MLAYLATKERFLRDAPTIEDIVAAEVKKNLNLSVGPSEYQAWKNSLGNAMSHVMLDSQIPDDAAVAVEYRLNGRKFRIDFLIAGQDAVGRDSIVIVELKQWTDVDYSRTGTRRAAICFGLGSAPQPPTRSTLKDGAGGS